MVETKGVMGKMIGRNRWASSKYSMGWDRFLRKDEKRPDYKGLFKRVVGNGFNDRKLGFIRQDQHCKTGQR